MNRLFFVYASSSNSKLSNLYLSEESFLYHTQERYRPPKLSNFPKISISLSRTILEALVSLLHVKLLAGFPHGSIFPVDSGVSIPRNLTLMLSLPT